MILKKNQTILDFTIQFAGAVDELFNVALANGVSITEDIAAGTDLIVQAANLRVTKYFTGSSLDIATLAGYDLLPDGIGYMQIGASFRVI